MDWLGFLPVILRSSDRPLQEASFSPGSCKLLKKMVPEVGVEPTRS